MRPAALAVSGVKTRDYEQEVKTGLEGEQKSTLRELEELGRVYRREPFCWQTRKTAMRDRFVDQDDDILHSVESDENTLTSIVDSCDC